MSAARRATSPCYRRGSAVSLCGGSRLGRAEESKGYASGEGGPHRSQAAERADRQDDQCESGDGAGESQGRDRGRRRRRAVLTRHSGTLAARERRCRGFNDAPRPRERRPLGDHGAGDEAANRHNRQSHQQPGPSRSHATRLRPGGCGGGSGLAPFRAGAGAEWGWRSRSLHGRLGEKVASLREWRRPQEPLPPELAQLVTQSSACRAELARRTHHSAGGSTLMFAMRGGDGDGLHQLSSFERSYPITRRRARSRRRPRSNTPTHPESV
jgi:hypothetical protein